MTKIMFVCAENCKSLADTVNKEMAALEAEDCTILDVRYYPEDQYDKDRVMILYKCGGGSYGTPCESRN